MIFQKKYYFSHVFLSISSLWCLSLSITVIADNKLMECVTDVIYNLFYHIYPNAIVLKYIDIFFRK